MSTTAKAATLDAHDDKWPTAEEVHAVLAAGADDPDEEFINDDRPVRGGPRRTANQPGLNDRKRPAVAESPVAVELPVAPPAPVVMPSSPVAAAGNAFVKAARAETERRLGLVSLVVLLVGVFAPFVASWIWHDGTLLAVGCTILGCLVVFGGQVHTKLTQAMSLAARLRAWAETVLVLGGISVLVFTAYGTQLSTHALIGLVVYAAFRGLLASLTAAAEPTVVKVREETTITEA